MILKPECARSRSWPSAAADSGEQQQAGRRYDPLLQHEVKGVRRLPGWAASAVTRHRAVRASMDEQRTGDVPKVANVQTAD